MMRIAFVLNGKRVAISVDPETTLLELLRDEFHLSGTKMSCGRGECGACTVLVDGKAVDSCILYAVKANGTMVVTIEGLAAAGELHPIQKAFIENGAIQCGFCTPGMMLAAKGYLDEHPHPSEKEVAAAISGNLCRCGGYQQEVAAILEAAEKIREDDRNKDIKGPRRETGSGV